MRRVFFLTFYTIEFFFSSIELEYTKHKKKKIVFLNLKKTRHIIRQKKCNVTALLMSFLKSISGLSSADLDQPRISRCYLHFHMKISSGHRKMFTLHARTTLQNGLLCMLFFFFNVTSLLWDFQLQN